MAQVSDKWTIYEAAHLLNRAGFGGSPVEIKVFHERGRHGAVEWLLAAKESNPPARLAWADDVESEREAFLKKKEILAKLPSGEREKEKLAFQQSERKARREQLVSSIEWWINRMRETDAPLQEKMTLFWHDHFPSHSRKVNRPQWLLRQNELFRTEALGNFGRLTKAVAVDPAMMVYLDLVKSTKKQPNENFARELMELFTLGEGHYTEKDVTEAARAFTGYRLSLTKRDVVFAEKKWDDGEKELLGHKGVFDGEGVIDLLLAKPQCGSYLAGKIWEFFGDENPDPELLARLGGVFIESDYELKPLLRAIFLSEEFYAPRTMRSQIKSPIAFMLMMSRQLEAERWPEEVFRLVLEQLGQLPFSPPNVAGWDWGRAWINTDTLLTRYNFAGLVIGAGGDSNFVRDGKGKRKRATLLRGSLRRELQQPDLEALVPLVLREDVPKLVAELGFRLFQAPLSEKDRAAFESYANAKKEIMLTDAGVGELMHLMMSTPNYQLT